MRRLAIFFTYLNLLGDLKQHTRLFAVPVQTDSKWAKIQIDEYMRRQKERAERKKITKSKIPNFLKPIEPFRVHMSFVTGGVSLWTIASGNVTFDADAKYLDEYFCAFERVPSVTNDSYKIQNVGNGRYAILKYYPATQATTSTSTDSSSSSLRLRL